MRKTPCGQYPSPLSRLLRRCHRQGRKGFAFCLLPCTFREPERVYLTPRAARSSGQRASRDAPAPGRRAPRPRAAARPSRPSSASPPTRRRRAGISATGRPRLIPPLQSRRRWPSAAGRRRGPAGTPRARSRRVPCGRRFRWSAATPHTPSRRRCQSLPGSARARRRRRRAAQ